MVYRQLTGEDGTVFPDFADLNEKWIAGGEYITVYPNVLLGVQRDHAFVIVLEPETHQATREHIHLYYASEKTDDALRLKNSAQ